MKITLIPLPGKKEHLFYRFSGNEVFGAYFYLYWVIATAKVLNPFFCDLGNFLYLLVESEGGEKNVHPCPCLQQCFIYVQLKRFIYLKH